MRVVSEGSWSVRWTAEKLAAFRGRPPIRFIFCSDVVYIVLPLLYLSFCRLYGEIFADVIVYIFAHLDTFAYICRRKHVRCKLTPGS